MTLFFFCFVFFLLIFSYHFPACLNYTLSTLHGQTGTCAILETQTGLASLVDCSMLCLDTDSCRGSTFYGNGTCLLHDCGNNTLGTSDATFIKRSCFGGYKIRNLLVTNKKIIITFMLE